MEELVKKYTTEELREIFEKMDWDKNGTVSPIEFKSYLANLKKGEEVNSDEVYQAFDKIDTDGSRQIQWEEFLKAMTTMTNQKSGMCEDDLNKLFNELDDDGNGFITPREAKKAYRMICERFNIKRSQIDEWIKRTDFDSDGKITLEEFKLGIAGNTLLDEV